MAGSPGLFPVFVGVWIALSVVQLRVFYGSRNVALNRRLIPAFYVGTSAVLILFVALISGSLQFVLLYAVPSVALISFLNYKSMTLCESCGRTNSKYFWRGRRSFCPRCGAMLPR